MAKETPIFDFDQSAMRTMACQFIKNLRGRYRFDVTKCKDQRSLNQNAYYWGVVLPHLAAGMGEAWGESLASEEVHEFCRAKFLNKPVVNRKTGKIQGQSHVSTASLDTKEFGEYLEQIIRFAAESLSVQIPQADILR